MNFTEMKRPNPEARKKSKACSRLIMQRVKILQSTSTRSYNGKWKEWAKWCDEVIDDNEIGVL